MRFFADQRFGVAEPDRDTRHPRGWPVAVGGFRRRWRRFSIRCSARCADRVPSAAQNAAARAPVMNILLYQLIIHHRKRVCGVLVQQIGTRSAYRAGRRMCRSVMPMNGARQAYPRREHLHERTGTLAGEDRCRHRPGVIRDSADDPRLPGPAGRQSRVGGQPPRSSPGRY